MKAPRHCDDDRGSVTLMLVVLVLALFLCIGLVVDGGAKIGAVQQANRVAAEAARAGTQQVDVAEVQLGGAAQLAPAAARTAAYAALAAAGVNGSVTVTGTQVTVTTTLTKPTVFLGLLGIGHVTGTGTAIADLAIT